MSLENSKDNEWKKSPAGVFWGEIAPTGHLVQIYENEDVVLDTLEGFVTSGIETGESVVIIATDDHLNTLNKRLTAHGFDLNKLQFSHQYIPLDAHSTLAQFMVDGWPDESLFMLMVEAVIKLARGENNRKVRVYGEMVAVLWGQGLGSATVLLEHMWNRFCAKETFCLFCAYPRAGFTQNAEVSVKHICSTHTTIIAGDEKSKVEVFYKNPWHSDDKDYPMSIKNNKTGSFDF